MPASCRGSSPAASIRRRDRAVWPSTGNYCRGGVAISRILGCRGVAVLPAGMSRERFDWLEQLGQPIPRTSSGRPAPRATSRKSTTSARELARDPHNVILNQFSEFAQLPHPLHLHRRGARPRLRAICKRDDAATAARRVRLRDGLGRHDRRGRLPEGAPRHEDRRGRGARMPDDAR